MKYIPAHLESRDCQGGKFHFFFDLDGLAGGADWLLTACLKVLSARTDLGAGPARGSVLQYPTAISCEELLDGFAVFSEFVMVIIIF